MSNAQDIAIPGLSERAPIPTWFNIGGGADRTARPRTEQELRLCLSVDPELVVLGGGANLLVDDAGTDRLVVVLDSGVFVEKDIDEATGRVAAGAGCDFPRLLLDTVRAGLSGLEGLGGIPGTVGGLVRMNAGGKFGSVADSVVRVNAMNRSGERVVLERSQIPFGYRRSGLEELVITSAEFGLTPGEPGVARERLKEVMRYKSQSQPMGADSAGCCFKNPTLDADLEDIGRAGEVVPAGLLIDRSGCKGMTIGGATVSDRHANFIVTSPGATAGEVIALMDRVTEAVRERFGVELEREVVVWSRRA